MVKVMGIILMALGCAGVGFQKSRDIKARSGELEMLLHMVMVLKAEIRYGNTALGEAFWNTAEKLPGTYRDFLRAVALEMDKNQKEKLGELFRQGVKEYLNRLHLEREEISFFAALGDKLGFLDKELQLKQLELYEMELARRLERLRMELPEKIRLYRNLGLLGGAALAVMMW